MSERAHLYSLCVPLAETQCRASVCLVDNIARIPINGDVREKQRIGVVQPSDIYDCKHDDALCNRSSYVAVSQGKTIRSTGPYCVWWTYSRSRILGVTEFAACRLCLNAAALAALICSRVSSGVQKTTQVQIML